MIKGSCGVSLYTTQDLYVVRRADAAVVQLNLLPHSDALIGVKLIHAGLCPVSFAFLFFSISIRRKSSSGGSVEARNKLNGRSSAAANISVTSDVLVQREEQPVVVVRFVFSGSQIVGHVPLRGYSLCRRNASQQIHFSSNSFFHCLTVGDFLIHFFYGSMRIWVLYELQYHFCSSDWKLLVWMCWEKGGKVGTAELTVVSHDYVNHNSKVVICCSSIKAVNYSSSVNYHLEVIVIFKLCFWTHKENVLLADKTWSDGKVLSFLLYQHIHSKTEGLRFSTTDSDRAVNVPSGVHNPWVQGFLTK